MLKILFASALLILAIRFVWQSIASHPSRALVNLGSIWGTVFVLSLLVPFSRHEILLTRTAEWFACLLPLITALPFSITLNSPLLFDSNYQVVDVSNKNLAEVLQAWYVHPTSGDMFFRPMGYLSFWLNYKVVGFSVVGWHVSNLLLHICAVYLLFLLSKTLGFSVWASSLASLILGLHGSSPEVVSWVAARFDQLSVCFVLGSLILICRDYNRNTRWTLMLALICCVGAVTSKEAAFCLPILSLCCLLLKRPLNGNDWKVLAYLTGTCILVLAYRAWVVGGVGGYHDAAGTATALHFNPLRILQLFAFRIWGVLFFPINWSKAPSSLSMMWLVLVFIALGLVTMMARPSAKKIALCVAFIFASVIPAWHLALLDYTLIGSRVYHLAVVGFALLIAVAYDSIERRRIASILVGTLVIFQSSALVHNLMIWKDTAELAGRACASIARLAGPDGKIVLETLPSTHNGVHFLSDGLPECVFLNSGRQVQIELVHDADDSRTRFAWDEQTRSIRQQR